jgi:enoyl-[acyl-carrier-protein] reductase (NADH)
MPNSEARIAETIRRTPAGRLATAEEIAFGAQFLCSDAASGVIGQTLVLDNGAGIMA